MGTLITLLSSDTKGRSVSEQLSVQVSSLSEHDIRLGVVLDVDDPGSCWMSMTRDGAGCR